MSEGPAYLLGSVREQERRRRKLYISPCQIVSWAFLYFFVFALHFTAIFFTGRNFQRHDVLGPQQGFGNKTGFINLFLLLSFTFMYYSAQFGHYFFPSLSYILPLSLSLHFTFRKYDNFISTSYLVLWIPIHFCVVVVWYFHTKLRKEETDAHKRDIMKLEFIVFILFYICMILMLDGMFLFSYINHFISRLLFFYYRSCKKVLHLPRCWYLYYRSLHPLQSVLQLLYLPFLPHNRPGDSADYAFCAQNGPQNNSPLPHSFDSCVCASCIGCCGKVASCGILRTPRHCTLNLHE